MERAGGRRLEAGASLWGGVCPNGRGLSEGSCRRSPGTGRVSCFWCDCCAFDRAYSHLQSFLPGAQNVSRCLANTSAAEPLPHLDADTHESGICLYHLWLFIGCY